MSLIEIPNSNPEFIKLLIPQREPMIMVDTIFDYKENSVTAGFTVSEDCIFVAENMLQESGILEHMAQSVALYTGYQYYIQNRQAPTGYIGSMKNIEMIECPKVGTQLCTTVHIIHEVMGVTLVNIETKENEQLIAFGEMKTVIAE